MTEEDFKRLVAAGIDALPVHVKAAMKNVAVVVADRPVLGAGGETLFGLYEGVPQTERGVDYFALPDKITIYREPILAAYSDPEDVQACVANTVWHEVAHHFGMDEDEVAR